MRLSSRARRRGSVARFAACLLLAAEWIGCGAKDGASPPLLLRGFAVVDVESASVRRADVLIVEGHVHSVTDAGSSDANALTPGEQRPIEIDAQGRWLMPAFWDLQAAPWGNMSTQPSIDPFQVLGLTEGLRVQLYYGVAHVLAGRLLRFWAAREMRRAAALEIPAAELIYPDLPLCASPDPRRCWRPAGPDAVPALLDELQAQGVETVQLCFNSPDAGRLPGLAPDTFEAALRAADQRSLRTLVLVDTWQGAEHAIALGARTLYGLPRGTLSDTLIESMRDQGVLFAPALSESFELPRILGNPTALRDPFLVASVPSSVLHTFETPDALPAPWRALLDQNVGVQEAALRDVLRLSQAGVRLLSASAAGATAGTFQGYSSHATQAWLERAGVEAWARLRALSVWPAAFMQRRAGFQPGDPADFVALEQDPLTGSEALRSISFIVRDGQYVQRSSLAPDVSRSRFKP